MQQRSQIFIKPNCGGEFYGYANIFNVEDSQGDIILNGAFSKTLRKNREIKLLLQHRQRDVIGCISSLKEDFLGLYVAGKIDRGSKLGDTVYGYVKSNLLNGLSIGYIADDCHRDGRGRRIIESVDLLEISLVSSPANRFSKIIYCKSKWMGDDLAKCKMHLFSKHID
ncbi:MAG: HK97 family phage prohead protease [Rickettsiales bacterium]|jgi:HK97 family phage prohead protease|nr:HK97 family phage prohead protease [Rickettsiales bacterium]